jgi:hypothetical protein
MHLESSQKVASKAFTSSICSHVPTNFLFKIYFLFILKYTITLDPAQQKNNGRKLQKYACIYSHIKFNLEGYLRHCTVQKIEKPRKPLDYIVLHNLEGH